MRWRSFSDKLVWSYTRSHNAVTEILIPLESWKSSLMKYKMLSLTPSLCLSHTYSDYQTQWLRTCQWHWRLLLYFILPMKRWVLFAVCFVYLISIVIIMMYVLSSCWCKMSCRIKGWKIKPMSNCTSHSSQIGFKCKYDWS